MRPNEGFEAALLRYERELGIAPPAAGGGGEGAREGAACELCELRRRSRWFDASDPRFVVLECETCDLPMAVWRAHTMAVSEGARRDMERSLELVARRVFGSDDFYVDKKQRTIADHLHWHARPASPALSKAMRARSKL